nr:phosphopantetheine-binding protein [Streptosporangium amethystogenes]
MVPSVFVPLPAIPLNRNGKVDRSALAEVNAAWDTEKEPAPRRARTAVEGQIADLIAGLLGIGSDDVGADEDLFARGIDSLGAVRLMASVEQRLGVKVKLRRFLANATVSGLATLVSAALPERAPAAPLPVITPLTVSSSAGDPLYCFHPLGGSARCYAGLAARLAAYRPVYAVQALESGMKAGSLPEMAARYARDRHDVLPGGRLPRGVRAGAAAALARQPARPGRLPGRLVPRPGHPAGQ